MIDQIVIGVLGVGALLCSQSRAVKIQRWCCVLGLTAQPFWLYTVYEAKQYGIMFLCVCYTLGYLWGLYNFWIRND